MATDLITDVTSEYMNSYCSLEDAEAYHDTTSEAEAAKWTGFTEDQKVRALIQATRMIDQLMDFVGRKTNPLQSLSWPRKCVPVDPESCEPDLFPDTTIPKFLIFATAELARTSFDPGLAATSTLLSQIGEFKAGSLQVKFKDIKTVDDLPTKVLLMLRKYGAQDIAEDDGLFGSLPFTRG